MSKSKPSKSKPKSKKPTPIVAKLLGDAQQGKSGRAAFTAGGAKPNTSAKTFGVHRSKNG